MPQGKKMLTANDFLRQGEGETKSISDEEEIKMQIERMRQWAAGVTEKNRVIRKGSVTRPQGVA